MSIQFTPTYNKPAFAGTPKNGPRPATPAFAGASASTTGPKHKFEPVTTSILGACGTCCGIPILGVGGLFVYLVGSAFGWWGGSK